MNFKKALFTGIATAGLMASAAAFAAPPTFVTVNNSGLYSTVKINGICATQLNPNNWTGPGKTTISAPWAEATSLCHGASQCVASLYLGARNATSCAGAPVTTITLNSASGMVTPGAPAVAAGGKTVTLTGGTGRLTMA